uniref:Uncharacterized protein n=1 Tax=Arabidopsis thaliana TaxID=3702 RepID=Q56ZW3_ARATH|nr:hypothetical protein [Arabidopsis thaliana]
MECWFGVLKTVQFDLLVEIYMTVKKQLCLCKFAFLECKKQNTLDF